MRNSTIKNQSRIILFSMLLCCTSAYAQIDFEDQLILGYSSRTSGAVSAIATDLDADGDLDVLTASLQDGKIAWYENLDGSGEFGRQNVITNDIPGVISLQANDLDGDGDIDVVAGSFVTDDVSWFENIDGLGTFGSKQTITTNTAGVQSIHSIDLDGDGDIDILSASISDDKIAWYENLDGAGNFGVQQIINDGAEGAQSVFANDIDGDGDIDVLSASPGDDEIVWYENMDGQGNFGFGQILSFNAARWVSAGDLDSDGDMDILAAGGSEVVWFQNMDGLGSFASQQSVAAFFNEVLTVSIADLDGDGDMDILATAENNDEVIWYENEDGLGSFGTEQIITSIADQVKSASAADIDGDGDIDVISASHDDSKIAWYENTDGQGAFSPHKVINSDASGISSVFVADIDGDSDMDIISASAGGGNRVAWYENLDGQGSYSKQKTFSTYADWATSVHASDLDGDGDMDVLFSSFENDKIAWFENLDGQGTFGLEQIITTDVSFAIDVYVSDLDGDGDMDVLSASENDNKIAWYENTNGQGLFGLPQVITTSAEKAVSVHAEDLDGDGDMDVISASRDDDKIAWYENTDGLGSFGPQQVVTTTADGANVTLSEDIDGDGDMDIISASFGDDKIAWYENTDGQGSFGPEQIITTLADGVHSAYVVDLDNDGDIDVLSAAALGKKIAWHENTDGQGVFAEEQIIKTYLNTGTTVIAGDLNADGHMDVISSSSVDHELFWHKNIGLTSNEITGIIRLDTNANGCDVSDFLVAQQMVITEGAIGTTATFSLSNGLYQLFPGEGEFATTVSPSIPDYFDVNPNPHISNFVGVGIIDVADFCLEPNQSINDLTIAIYPTSEARAGFNATYQLVYNNVGTNQLSGDITFTFDENKVDFLTASEPVASQTSNTLVLNYTNLSPFETRIINLEFYISGDLNDVLNFTSSVTPIVGDNTEENNTFELDQVVIGSFDPNDIRVLEGETITIDEIDNYLHYIIRFQNVGTASAINVKISNVLDPNLDWTTLQLESSSHSNRVEVIDNNQAFFIFDEIHLPDSTTNEPASHGFISYKIKPKANLAVGEVISNKADIFFDFNLPVQTNTVTTEIVEPSSIGKVTAPGFLIFPSPVADVLFIRSTNKVVFMKIYNCLGHMVLCVDQKGAVNVSNLNQGLYSCLIKDDKGNTEVLKFVKQ